MQHPRVKVQHGADGSATDVSSASPMPVVQTGELPAGTQNIGDVDVASLPSLPAGSNNIGDVDVVSMPTVTVTGEVDATTFTKVLNKEDVQEYVGQDNPIPIQAKELEGLLTELIEEIKALHFTLKLAHGV